LSTHTILDCEGTGSSFLANGGISFPLSFHWIRLKSGPMMGDFGLSIKFLLLPSLFPAPPLGASRLALCGHTSYQPTNQHSYPDPDDSIESHYAGV